MLDISLSSLPKIDIASLAPTKFGVQQRRNSAVANLYLYAEADPVSLSDPLGLFAKGADIDGEFETENACLAPENDRTTRCRLAYSSCMAAIRFNVGGMRVCEARYTSCLTNSDLVIYFPHGGRKGMGSVVWP